MVDPFDLPKKMKAFPDRTVVVRSGGHRHSVWNLDDLLGAAAEAGGGGGGGGGVPVVDSSTGQVVAIARPDPVDGVYTYVDPRTTVVEESSGQGRSVTVGGEATVRAVINTPSPTQPPEEPVTPEPTADFAAEAPETKPRCIGGDCFVTAPCFPAFSSTTHIAPQTLIAPTNLGDKSLLVIFAGPRRPPGGQRAIIQEVEITPQMTGPTLIPPAGTDTIFIACSGSGSVKFRFSAGVA
jgi:hypothetical protein